MISDGNHDVATRVLMSKMNMESCSPPRFDDDDATTLQMNGALPPTKAPTSTKGGSTTIAPTELPIGARLSAPTVAPTDVPTVIGARTVKRSPSPIGAMSSKNRKVPFDGKTLPPDDLILPYDLEGSEDDVKEEYYEDVPPCYDVKDDVDKPEMKVCKGSVRSSGR